MRPVLLALSMVLPFASFGCSASGTDSATRYRDSVGEILCARLACPTAEPGDVAVMLELGGLEGCQAYIGGRFASEGGALDAALRRGTVRLDEQALETCLESARTTCHSLATLACRTVVGGTVAEGGACSIDEECLEGGCTKPSGATCGTCVTGTTPLGGSCDSRNECAPSPDGRVECQLVCTLFVEQGVIPSAIGGPCDVVVGANGEVAECGRDAYCDATNTCRAPRPVGATCTLGADACVAEAVCSPGPGDPETRCRVLAVMNEVGEPCDGSAPRLRLCNSYAGLYCDPGTLTCSRLGDGTSGSGCLSDAGCSDGLFCSKGTCVARFPNGLACTSSSHCVSRFCMVPEGALGGVCWDPKDALAICSAP